MNQVVQIPEKALPEKMGSIRVGGGGIRAIVPNTLEDVFRLATLVGKSQLAPKDIDTPEKITVALLHGMEIGLPPMMALQRIAVINGRPAIWGDAALGLVRASGLCEFVREFIEGKDDARYAVCETRRKGEADIQRRVFSVADAKRASLWGKTGANGRPTPWVTHPDRMLQMRARGFCLRDTYSDVLGGMYLAEELQGDDISMRDITPPSPPSPPPATKPAQAEIIPPSPKAKPADDLEIPAGLKRPKEPPPPHDEDGVLIDDTPLDRRAPEAELQYLLDELANHSATEDDLRDWVNDTADVRKTLFPPDQETIRKAIGEAWSKFA